MFTEELTRGGKMPNLHGIPTERGINMRQAPLDKAMDVRISIPHPSRLPEDCEITLWKTTVRGSGEVYVNYSDRIGFTTLPETVSEIEKKVGELTLCPDIHLVMITCGVNRSTGYPYLVFFYQLRRSV